MKYGPSILTHAQSIFGLHYVCCDVVCVNGGREPSPFALSVQKVKCKMNVVFIVISCVYYECQALRSHSLHVAVFSISLFVLYTKRTRRNTWARCLPACLLLLCTVPMHVRRTYIQEKMFSERAKDKVPKRKRRAISRHLFGPTCALIVVAVIKSDNKSFNEVEMCPI